LQSLHRTALTFPGAIAPVSVEPLWHAAEFSIPQPFSYCASLGIRLEVEVCHASAKELFFERQPRRSLRCRRSGACSGWDYSTGHSSTRKVATFIPPPARSSTPLPALGKDPVVSWRGGPLAFKAEFCSKAESAIPDLRRAIDSCAGHGTTSLMAFDSSVAVVRRQ